MNARTQLPATQQQPSKIDTFVGEVLPPERIARLGLPSHVKPVLFERNLYNAIAANPALMNYDVRLIFREVSKAAGLGLMLDPLLGEGYIIESYNYKTKSKEPQLRVGYRGFIKLARQSGDVTQIYAHEVCQNDFIQADLGADKALIHRPDIFGDRGPIVGYYAVVKFKDGGFDFEPMSVDQIHGIRDRSDAWKAFKEGIIRSTPWSTDESEMAKKTTIRRLQKRIPQSPELTEAFRIEQEADGAWGAQVALQPPTPPAMERIAAQPQRQRAEPQARDDRPYVDQQQASTGPATQQQRSDEPPPPPDDQESQREQVSRTAAQPKEEAQPPAPPPDADEPQGQSGDDGRDYSAMLAELEKAMASAGVMAELNAISRDTKAWVEAAPDEIYNRAIDLYNEHSTRIARGGAEDLTKASEPPKAAVTDKPPATASVNPKPGDSDGWTMRGREDFDAGVAFNKYPVELKADGRLEDKECWLSGWSGRKKESAKK